MGATEVSADAAVDTGAAGAREAREATGGCGGQETEGAGVRGHREEARARGQRGRCRRVDRGVFRGVGRGVGVAGIAIDGTGRVSVGGSRVFRRGAILWVDDEVFG